MGCITCFSTIFWQFSLLTRQFFSLRLQQNRFLTLLMTHILNFETCAH
ncbi:hypothetical protein APX70_200116 [Pseudomonas syringae pv. maculicola]|uniref:Uncharacterized protein n=1 Tax=Pseudomonas syringae pv. maculicola TaxID=59511 RepID=A0A3M2XGK1_PSEYM|nr:hypothetical protein APX70_200116 [Pseudomonas syringae pv. maculicola]